MRDLYFEIMALVGRSEEGSDFANFLIDIEEAPVLEDGVPEPGKAIISTRYYRFINSGLEFVCEYGKFKSINIYKSGSFSYSSYPFICGVGIAEISYSQVLERFGSPERGGKARISPLIGKVKSWIRYSFGNFLVRFEFEDDGSLWMVTLMPQS